MTVLDQWGGVVWDNSACWSVRVRNKKCDMFVLTLIKLQIKEEAPCRLSSGDATLARGGFVSGDNAHRK